MRDNIGKYRGQRKDGGEWVYGYYCEVGGTSFIIEEPTPMTMGMIGLYLSPLDMNEVIPETVGESINKFDKSSTKMHEGDILLSKDGLRKYAVTYNEKHLCWYLKGVGNAWCVLDMIHWEDYEIIGNIHEEKP